MSEENWYALYVRSRHEFVVAGELLQKGIKTFLPSVVKLNQWKDRKKQVKVPLFPGYLFVNVAPDPIEFLKVIKTRGAVSLISLQPGFPTPVDPEVISALKIVLESGEEFDIYPHLKEGTPVQVRRGALRGAKGILAKKHNQHEFVIAIELLGRSVSVKIYADDVETA